MPVNQHTGITAAELSRLPAFDAVQRERIERNESDYWVRRQLDAVHNITTTDATARRARLKWEGSNGGERAPMKKEEVVEWDVKGDAATVSAPRGRVTTLEELLALANVDTTQWFVERWLANTWESASRTKEGDVIVTPLMQCKAWLRRIPGVQAMHELRDLILADIADHAPAYPVRVKAPKGESGYLLEVSPFDLHLAKLAHSEENDDENYDSKIACELLDRALTDVLSKAAPFRPERILFPIGNDLLNSDGPTNTTTAGTPQDSDTRHALMFQRAVRLMVHAIDRLELIAPVDVIVVPGNHDQMSAMHLGEVLCAWYRNNDRVDVDNSPTLRKYYRWGTCIVAFTHGNEEKHSDLPLILAQERPKDWAETTCREWHTGHFHLRRATRYTAGDTLQGVVVRVLPALSGVDHWHYKRGYVKGVRAMEAYIFHRDDGYAGHFSFTHRSGN